MKRSTLWTLLLGLAFFACVQGLPAHAQTPAAVVFVASFGNDTNACTRASPCRSFLGGVGAAGQNGVVNCLDSGPFGGVSIESSVTIDCDGAVLFHSQFVVFAGAGSRVFLRGITIQCAGNEAGGGVVITDAGAVFVDHMVITGCINGINMEPLNAGAELHVTNTYLFENAGSGISIAPQQGGSAMVTIANTHANANNSRGLSVDTGNGSGGVRVTVTDSSFNGNARAGIVAASAGGTAVIVMVDRSEASNNGTFGVTTNGQSAAIEIGRSTVSGNQTGIQPQVGTILSYGDNHVQGNTSNGFVTGAATTL